MSFPFGQYANLTTSSGTVDVASGINIDRVGIQGEPGMAFTLNNEVLTLGKNGCYEVETDVTNLTVDRANVFIIDYHIKEE